MIATYNGGSPDSIGVRRALGIPVKTGRGVVTGSAVNVGRGSVSTGGVTNGVIVVRGCGKLAR